MTIEQLITKLKTATNIPWSYDQVDDGTLNIIGMANQIAYRLIANNDINASIPHIVAKDFIAPLTPDSFAVKELIDNIISNLELGSVDLLKLLQQNKDK